MGKLKRKQASRALVASIASALDGMDDDDILTNDMNAVGVHFEVDEQGDDYLKIIVNDTIEDSATHVFTIAIKEGWE